MHALRSTVELGLRPDLTGKVREIFHLGETMLIVATDRVSAFDVVMDDVVPGRGVVLSVMTSAWLSRFPDLPNHLLTMDPADFPPPFARHRAALAGRSMLVRKAERVPIECVARGYVAGSAWASYRDTGQICGLSLPPGLRQGQRLPAPVFTPATKEDSGHDINIAFEEMAARVGEETAASLRDLTLRIYDEAHEYAASRGVLVADTKLEFGFIDGRLALIDEVLTPDSSRFWPADDYRPGSEPPSWDKQILRNHLSTLDWNREPPPPPLPAEVLARTAARYREVLEILFPEEVARWRQHLS